MSTAVAERIRARIRERGPITFAEYMREALYGDGGFYERHPVGADAHFVTSPHVHPVFSRLVGAALEELWRRLGRPDPLRVVELGAGDGTLARELLDGFARGGIPLRYAGVEIAAGARATLSEISPEAVARLSDLEPLDPGVVVANELLDNLPFDRLRRRGDELFEVRIGLDGDRLVEVEVPAEAGEVPGLEDRDDDGRDIVVSSGALALVDELAASLRCGYALLIDYTSDSGGSVRGYRDHRELDDVLDRPGSADITADVDLGPVIAHARALGFAVDGPIPQRDALKALGLDAWLRDELSHQVELLRDDHGLAAVRTWQGRSRARLLTDPAGLGRLRWVLLRTEGLATPGWADAGADAPPG